MDTKAGEIIVQAFRDGGFEMPPGASLAEEMQEALPRLNSLLFSLVGLELGEAYHDWPVPPNRASSVPSRYPLGPINEDLSAEQYLNPPANVRIVASNASVLTVYFPSAPQDGARMAYVDAGAGAVITLHGNGRLIQGVASVDGQGGSRRWIYRADTGNWTCLEKLQMNSTLPLPPEFDELFICGLILRLAPRFKATPADYVAACFGDALNRLKKRYRQSAAEPATVGFPSFSPSRYVSEL